MLIMKKTYFYIFILLTNIFIDSSKVCDPVIIRYSEYNLSILISGDGKSSGIDIIGNKKIQAFNYDYLISYKNDLISTLSSLAYDIKKYEENKFQIDHINYFIEMLIKRIGNDTNGNTINNIFNRMESFVKDDNDNSTQIFKKTINDIREQIKYNYNITHSYSSITTKTLSNAAISSISGATLTKIATTASILSPTSLIIGAAVMISFSIVQKIV